MLHTYTQLSKCESNREVILKTEVHRCLSLRWMNFVSQASSKVHHCQTSQNWPNVCQSASDMGGSNLGTTVAHRLYHFLMSSVLYWLLHCLFHWQPSEDLNLLSPSLDLRFQQLHQSVMCTSHSCHMPWTRQQGTPSQVQLRNIEKQKLLYFEWSPPWHFKTATLDFMPASSGQVGALISWNAFCYSHLRRLTGSNLLTYLSTFFLTYLLTLFLP